MPANTPTHCPKCQSMGRPSIPAKPCEHMHTPTPWTVDECGDANGNTTIRLADGSANGDTDARPIATVYCPANAARIVACVNACAGIEDPVRAIARARAALVLAEERLENLSGHPLEKGIGQYTAGLRIVRAALAALGGVQ